MWPLEVQLRVLRDTRGTSGVHTTLGNLPACETAGVRSQFMVFAISLWEHVFLPTIPQRTYLSCKVWQQLPRLHGWHAVLKVRRLSYSGAARVSQPQTDASRYLERILRIPSAEGNLSKTKTLQWSVAHHRKQKEQCTATNATSTQHPYPLLITCALFSNDDEEEKGKCVMMMMRINQEDDKEGLADRHSKVVAAPSYLRKVA